jgi:uncharacterized membrane protein YkoI
MNSLRKTLGLVAALACTAGAAAAQQPASKDTTHKAPAYTREGPDSLLSAAKVTEDSARALALHRVRGIVQAVELEREHGKLIWSFDVKVRGKTGITEVNVDAVTGTIVGVAHEGSAP